MTTRILNERQAAEFLGFSIYSLQKWRHQGRGPSYLKVGRSVRYQVEDLEKFLQEHKVTRSAA